jgi:hypothetical protein
MFSVFQFFLAKYPCGQASVHVLDKKEKRGLINVGFPSPSVHP